MPKQRRTFTAEFKKQMVQLYENGKSRADLVENMVSQPRLWIAGLSKLRQRAPSRRRTIVHPKKTS
ncbi:transposase [Paenibacillus peoriae]|uniref:hypothetical protein n=1 Tax=Paenibacillus peoriae TaxID=59893 RepID=UPI00026C606F|nr:hypothetical protein [Paenibacillus peoriae]MEC0184718.1 transposase [Paenibacillus peoriae]